MIHIGWSDEKNTKLRLERGVGFEDIVIALDEGRILDTIQHPNQSKYPGQKIFIVNINDYCYLVPFTETSNEIFFKTIIPDRKATKKYLKIKKG